MNDTFARRFTAIAATMVIALVAITLFFRTFGDIAEKNKAAKYTNPLRIHLNGYNFKYDDLKITDTKAGGSFTTVGIDRTVYYQAKNLRHPALGQADTASLRAVLIDDNADGDYRLQDFSVIYPERMQVLGWYHH